jgi:anion transporter
MAYVESIRSEDFEQLLKKGYEVKTEELRYDRLTESEQRVAARAGFQVKVAVGMLLFVVTCFITEAIPLPVVAFCIGIIAVSAGIVNREEVAALYWSDASWFIMGSLMFSVAFIKTGLDKRIALMIFGRLKSHDIKWITLIIIVTLGPLTMFMSDHALAAMFLPIGILMYTTARTAAGREDPELAKMLMITIAMACNLGGSLVPSGAARNIIMMSYAEDLFGVNIGFGEWSFYCVPYIFLVIPVTWVVINWRFKPSIRNLGPSIAAVRSEVRKDGGKWTRQQIISLIVFGLTLFCWITEKDLILKLTGVRFGIGVFAVIGAVVYILVGIVNWRDYQTKVDWGVVWLYAGAIIFGHILVKTGGAYWVARSIISLTARLGLAQGMGLLLSANLITGLITQIMADGPACAAVGPITLSMAGIVHPGTSMIPFIAMGTAVSSSLAYCLVIGTPPNAIVYASGYLAPKDFLRVGIILWFTNMAAMMLLAGVYWGFLGWRGLPSF